MHYCNPVIIVLPVEETNISGQVMNEIAECCSDVELVECCTYCLCGLAIGIRAALEISGNC